MFLHKLCLGFFLISTVYGTNVIIKNITECGQPMQHLSMDCDTPKNGALQYCNVVIKTSVEEGDNFRFECTAEILRGKRWRKLGTLKQDKGLCLTLEIYLKQVLYNFFEGANLPKQCPLKKGTTSSKHVGIDFSNLKMVVLPKGFLRLHVKTYEKTSERLGICIVLDFESK